MIQTIRRARASGQTATTLKPWLFWFAWSGFYPHTTVIDGTEDR